MKNTKITIKKKEENMTKKYQIEAGSKVEMVVGNKIKKVTLAYTSILTQDHLLYIDTSNKGTFYNFLIGNSQYIVSSKLVKEAPKFKDIALTKKNGLSINDNLAVEQELTADLKRWIYFYNTFPLTKEKVTLPLTQEKADFIFSETSSDINDMEQSCIPEKTYIFSVEHHKNVQEDLIKMGFVNNA